MSDVKNETVSADEQQSAELHRQATSLVAMLAEWFDVRPIQTAMEGAADVTFARLKRLLALRQPTDTSEGGGELQWASCPGCNGTGDQGGNPSYGACDDCNGSGKIATVSAPPSPAVAVEAQPIHALPMPPYRFQGEESDLMQAVNEGPPADEDTYASPAVVGEPMPAMPGEIDMLFAGIRREAAPDNVSRLDRLEALLSSALTRIQRAEAQLVEARKVLKRLAAPYYGPFGTDTYVPLDKLGAELRRRKEIAVEALSTLGEKTDAE